MARSGARCAAVGGRGGNRDVLAWEKRLTGLIDQLAIAFRGRPDTRSFGTATCGLSTAIENYPISDGSMLNLAISTMADRARTKYGFALIPDEALSDPAQVVERGRLARDRDMTAPQTRIR